jgi:iron complex transport system ATP-binding protein
MKLLEARGLTVSLDDAKVLHDISLALERGEVLGLVGPNGAGKTTLLRILAGLLKQDSGSVIAGSSGPLAKELAYLPQGQEIHWPLSVRRLVELGRIPHLMPWQEPGAEDETAVEDAMRDTDIFHLADRSVDHLAGGERSLALLARALATKPSALLADEPAQGLDPSHSLQVMELFRKFAKEGRGIMVVLHDLTLAARFCDRLILLHRGQMIAQGKPEAVLTPENLAETYGIEAKYGHEEFYVIPWARNADARTHGRETRIK